MQRNSPNLSAGANGRKHMMNQAGYSELATASRIRALIIQPDGDHEVRDIPQELRTWQHLVGGHLEVACTDHCAL